MEASRTNKIRRGLKAKLRSAGVVLTSNSVSAGFLFMRNERVVVLINNVTSDADLGPLKSIRRSHTDPEADIKVFPAAEVKEIRIFRRTQ